MGYLNNSDGEIVVEAILTTAGREKLANGKPLNITKFALSDDEIDYSLYESSHPAGSEYAGNAIQNLPVMEAFPDDTQSLRYKLITAQRGTVKLPIVSVPSDNIVLNAGGAQDEIVPHTKNGSNNQLGYTAVLHDRSVATLGIAQGGSVNTSAGSIPNFLSDGDSRRQTVVGTKFVITANSILPTEVETTQVTIVGNQTGGTVTISVTIVGEDATR